MGTVIIPPPTPNKPASNPEKIPMIKKIIMKDKISASINVETFFFLDHLKSY